MEHKATMGHVPALATIVIRGATIGAILPLVPGVAIAIVMSTLLAFELPQKRFSPLHGRRRGRWRFRKYLLHILWHCTILK